MNMDRLTKGKKIEDNALDLTSGRGFANPEDFVNALVQGLNNGYI